MNGKGDKVDGVLPLDNAFRNALNSHGYAFQYSVIRAADKLSEEGQAEWVFEVAEFPVTVNGKDTRIDLVLRRQKTWRYIIGECKRANPALADWCFTRAPYVRRNPSSQKLFVESVDVVPRVVDLEIVDPRRPYRLIHAVKSGRSTKIYQIGLELKSNKKGEKNSSGGRSAIEEALGQVLRGVNGMVEFVDGHQQLLTANQSVLFVPVIFTTARLWTSEVDLGSADINTGTLESRTISMTSQPWIWLNYNQSPALKHSLGRQDKGDRMGDVLENEYVRSVAVVSSDGIEAFLKDCEF
jgi:hypothetical protein